MKKIIAYTVIIGLSAIALYYFFPERKFPANASIDKLIVLKSQRKMEAFSNGQLIKTYTVSIGKNPLGKKEYEGDERTPEGHYFISSKNAGSGYHKALGISYPNRDDILAAKKLNKPTGGDVEIHGLKNGQGYIGKFQRWKDWTNGCIALTDNEVDEIYNHTNIGTPMEINP